MMLLWTKKLLNGHRNIDARSADTSSVEQSIHRAKKYPAQTAETPTVPHDLINKANMFTPDIPQKRGSSDLPRSHRFSTRKQYRRNGKSRGPKNTTA